MYNYQVNYSKRFKDGLLINKLYHDFLRFADWNSANEFKQLCESGYVFKQFNGNGCYIVEDVTITAID